MEALDTRRMLLRLIQSRETHYNPQVRMLTSPFSSPGYHTTIKKADFIHSTRSSLIYALGLLDTELEEYEQRAFDIIRQVISLQDTDRSRSTFGIWPWFYEEPLEKMSPPDWNWADFCGKQLVLSVLRHGHRFPDELLNDVRRAVYNACDAIMIRNVGPNYTNIAIMGAFVTLIAGELYKREDYRTYGLERLEKLRAFTQERQAFQEYNSPPYTYIAILELSKIAVETKDDRAKAISGELADMAWRSVAEHYHAGTGQWSGPHSRCYQTLLSDQNKAFLQLATAGKLMFFAWEELPYEEEWYKSRFECPSKYMSLFLTAENRELRQCYESHQGGGQGKWATTFMTPSFALGSFSREILWNQRRALLAYVDNGGETTYLHLRCLHDGYDYCSAVFYSDQVDAHVLFGVGFLTNGGDTHPSLDKMNGSIEASDFRLRLEIGGHLDRISAHADRDGAVIGIHNTPVRLRSWHMAFGNAHSDEAVPWKWEINREEGVMGIDLVIYAGQRKTIDFRNISRAAFLFSLLFGTREEEDFVPEIEEDAEHIRLRGTWREREMRISMPACPVEQ
ncbi:hypothetical protein [Paenibacillus harenae]|uniref:hypothetical protein n=1 Tax=Paenibacillus harenae TaxID=306543 RepID=UPI00278D2CE1|nr:hypothetical protein [Paenibacillus harenae]MDQ0060563.1 hypothetical protein [Paenibacillus harenae]